MNHDRFVQLAAGTIAVICMLVASLIVPVINDQRDELLLFDVGEELSPVQAIATAAMGSFRGLIVDIAWIRAHQLQQEDKLYEANTLAQWITTLQPRFPQVWIFHAWNMSYNISFKAHTKEERWDWVMKGIRLLQDRGIVNNPHSVEIYRQLSYFYFHKIAGWADDMHWYYKRMIAEQWQELLGSPVEGATTAQVLERFKPVADAGDRYFLIDSPAYDARRIIEQLIERRDDRQINRDLQRFYTIRPEKILELLRERRSAWIRQYPDMTRSLDTLEQVLAEQVDRSQRDPLTMLYEDEPETRTVVEQLHAIDLDLDMNTLRRIGRMLILMQTISNEGLLSLPEDELDNTNKKILAILMNPDNRTGLDAIIPFLRAKVLIRDQHMDPGTMYEIMAEYGPLDWRHPVSHSIYWAYMGARYTLEVPDDYTRIELLNLERGGIIHSLQYMMLRGRLSFDPYVAQVEQSIHLMPDPRFIPMYEKAKYAVEEHVTRYGPKDRQQGIRQSFDTGHENFLLGAIALSYLYGDVEQARHYFDKARELYGQEPHNLRDGTYLKPLDDLVLELVRADMGQMPTATAFIESIIRRAIEEGLGESRPSVFSRYIEIARRAHAYYQQERTYIIPNAPRERLVLPSFREMIIEVYAQYMRTPSIDIWRRSKVYRNTPLQLAVQAYPRFHNVVMLQAQQAEYPGQAMFPPPEGFDQMDPVMPDEREETPETIERK